MNPNWLCSSSNDAKAIIIGKPWSTRLTDAYLWYFLGDQVLISTGAEHAALIGKHFHGPLVGGDFDLQPCRTPKGRRLLLRGNVILLPDLRGFPLLQVGHDADPDLINFALRWPTA